MTLKCARCGFSMATSWTSQTLICPKCKRPLKEPPKTTRRAAVKKAKSKNLFVQHPILWLPTGIGAIIVVLLFILVFRDPAPPPVAAPPAAVAPTPARPAPRTPPPPAAPKPAPKIRLTDLIQRFRSSVVWIAADRGIFKSTGTGFVVRKDGFILTNDHVVQEARRIRIGWERGAGFVVQDAAVVLRFPEDDLVLLKISHDALTPVAYAAGKPPPRGSDVAALGFPLSSAFGQDSMSITRGIVTGVGPFGSLPEIVRTDTQINPGNSGGPLVDVETGKVVGVVFARGTAGGQASGLGFAIPMARVLALMPEISGTAGALEARGVAASRSRIDSAAWRQELERTRPYFKALAGSSPAARRNIPVKTLILALEDSEPTVRSLAARELEARGPAASAARDALIKMLKDPIPTARLDAATALAAVSPGDVAVLDVLLPALEHPSARTREAAAIALGKLGNRSALTITALADALDDADGRVFEAAFKALDALGSDGRRMATPILVKKLEAFLNNPAATKPPVAVVDALSSCGAYAPETVARVLARALKDRRRSLMHPVARAFAGLGPKALPHLTPFLRERDAELRQTAISAIGRLRPVEREAIRAIEEWAEDPDPTVRSTVLSALSGMAREGAPISISTLVAFADDATPAMRAQAAAALGSLKSLSSEGIDALAESLGDSDATVRRTALGALRLHPDGALRVLDAIIGAMDDRDRAVRRMAVETLGRIGPRAKKANEKLYKIAEDKEEDRFLRETAIYAIYSINPELRPKK